MLAALWSLEEGCLSRYGTAAALNWSPDDTAIRMESVRVRLDVARSVTAALARTPRCPGLHRQTAAWDGRPGAAWRDELARHTAHCGHCLMGVGAAGPADLSAAPTETFAVVPDLPVSSAATEHGVTAAPAGGSGTTAPATPSPTASTGGTDTGPGGGPQHDTGQSSAADQVIALVNSVRVKAGCGPLSVNATLTRAAQGHSDDMAARNFFDHPDPDGDGSGERVTAAGYPWSTYGENIAKGQSTPEQVMESWMNSPGHRANILNCAFKEIGVGIHDDGGPYWTKVFGAR
ncbi:CAP domain-containing protein [Streptomyces sp. NPDC058872]|uniref:CAP domain-containing protein n=1 Tax=Streptomyces sp. NPDC058872 TaxID=3346661 RepID=UPI0036B0C249